MVETANVTKINIAGAWPNYVVTFTPDTVTRVHLHGHIWLNNEQAALDMPFEVPAGFSFDSDPANDTDGGLAMFISDNPGTVYDFPNNVPFSRPTLSNNGRRLTFGVTEFDHKVYYYLFNIRDKDSNLITVNDPIIVNR